VISSRKVAAAALILTLLIPALLTAFPARAQQAEGPTINILDTEAFEGDSLVFIVRLDGELAECPTVTVEYATADVTAKAGEDYQAKAGELVFEAAGDQQVAVATVQDDIAEDNENFLLTLQQKPETCIEPGLNIQGAEPGFIRNDDVPRVSIDDVSLAEGDGGVTEFVFTVSADTLNFGTVSVSYATSNGTATAGEDYAAEQGSVQLFGNFAGCEFCDISQSQTVTVEVNGDTENEPDETFSVEFVDTSGATIADGQGIGTILNDDAPPALSIADAQIVEGDAGTQLLAVDVTMDTLDNFESGSVLVSTSDVTATAGSDYDAIEERLVVPPPLRVNSVATDFVCECAFIILLPENPTFGTVEIPIHGDVIDEIDETFSVTLSEPEGDVTIADGEATVTIVDDDLPPPPPPVPLVSIGDVVVTEGDSGTTDATFTVSLSEPTTVAVSLDYATADASATSPADYASGGGAISFLPRETTKTISVPVAGDLLDETDETFSVQLGGAIGGTIADGTGVATILDDDDPPAISIADLAIAEGDSGNTAAAFSVSLDAPSAFPVVVEYLTLDGTALSPTDYQSVVRRLRFAPGETTQAAVVRVRGDELDEANENFFVDLFLDAGSNVLPGDTGAVGTILDDDEPLCVVDCEPDDGDTVGGTRIFLPPEDDVTDEQTDSADIDEEAEEEAPAEEEVPTPQEDEEEPSAPEIGLDKPSIAPGEDLTISGTGCAPGQEVLIGIDGNNVAVTRADDQGNFAIGTPTPGDLPVGRHALVATCGDQSAESPLDVVLTSSVQGIGGAPAAIITVFGLFLFFLFQGRELFEHERGEGRRHIAVAGVDGIDKTLAAPARVVATRSMSWGFVGPAIALLGVAGVVGLVGLDAPDRSASVGTGQVFIAGQDLAANDLVAIDAGEPVAITIGDQVAARADSVRVTLGVAGIDLTADEAPLVEQGGELGAQVDLSSRDFLVAGRVGGELQLLADGEVVSTHEFAAKSDESVYLSAPGEFIAGLLLFALAGAEILLRQMRRGRRRSTGIAGLAGIGVVAGFALGAIAALIGAQEPTGLVVGVTALLGAIAGVIAGIGTRLTQPPV
jgi:hypothetical protein